MRNQLLLFIAAILAILFVFGTWNSFQTDGVPRHPEKELSYDAKKNNQNDYHMAKDYYSKKASELKEKMNDSDLSFANLLTFLVPQIVCPTPVRLGNLADGGKWACSPWNAVSDGTKSTAYSLGVNNDVSFEVELYEILGKKCKIYCFDVIAQNAELFLPFNGSFKQWRIAPQTDTEKSEYAIDDIIGLFGDERIDFLKIDIEGGEYGLGPAFLGSKMMRGGAICQIFLEMHMYTGEDVRRWANMFEKLGEVGFLMFYKEHNYYAYHAHEYSFIHESCLSRFGIQDVVFFRSFGG